VITGLGGEGLVQLELDEKCPRVFLQEVTVPSRLLQRSVGAQDNSLENRDGKQDLVMTLKKVAI
jgi:hypothetical protein